MPVATADQNTLDQIQPDQIQLDRVHLDEEPGVESPKELLESSCHLDRVAIIFNPASGTQDCTTRRSSLEALARTSGLLCELEETDREQGAAPLARKALEDGMERVLVSGGDGSVTEAADVLAGTPVELAVLPGGTGNLLALNLGIPSDCAEAMELALHGQPQPFDVGNANGKVFVILAGIGADGRMIREADRKSKQKLGVFAYFVAALHVIQRQLTPFAIEIDGRRLRRGALTVMVANLGRITGGVELVPGCDPRDGLLEVAIVRTRGIQDAARVLVRALFGLNRSDRLLEVHRGRHILIVTRRPQPVELDGNEAGSTNRLEVTVEPGALRLVCPACEGETVPATPVALAAAGAKRNWAPLLAGLGVSGAAYVLARQNGKSAAGASGLAALSGLAVTTGAVRFHHWRTARQSASCPVNLAAAGTPG